MLQIPLLRKEITTLNLETLVVLKVEHGLVTADPGQFVNDVPNRCIGLNETFLRVGQLHWVEALTEDALRGRVELDRKSTRLNSSHT